MENKKNEDNSSKQNIYDKIDIPIKKLDRFIIIAIVILILLAFFHIFK